MTGRAELLELIDRAPGSLRTLRGHWQSWAHLGRAEAAQEKVYGEPRVRLSAGYSGPGPPVRKSWEDIWFESPNRWRVVSEGPPVSFNSLDICDGTTRWVGSEEQLGANEQRLMGYDRRTNTLHLSDPPLEQSIYPGAMLGWMSLSAPTAGERGGRLAWRVVARARTGSSSRRAPPEVDFLPGAEHTYVIDAATGIVLNHEATVDGEVCLRSGLTRVVIDEPIDDALFRPPEQAEVQTATEQELAMLEAAGVDTTRIDRTDPRAVRDAVHEWRQSQNAEGGWQTFRSPPPEPDPE